MVSVMISLLVPMSTRALAATKSHRMNGPGYQVTLAKTWTVLQDVSCTTSLILESPDTSATLEIRMTQAPSWTLIGLNRLLTRPLADDRAVILKTGTTLIAGRPWKHIHARLPADVKAHDGTDDVLGTILNQTAYVLIATVLDNGADFAKADHAALNTMLAGVKIGLPTAAKCAAAFNVRLPKSDKHPNGKPAAAATLTPVPTGEKPHLPGATRTASPTPIPPTSTAIPTSIPPTATPPYQGANQTGESHLQCLEPDTQPDHDPTLAYCVQIHQFGDHLYLVSQVPTDALCEASVIYMSDTYEAQLDPEATKPVTPASDGTVVWTWSQSANQSHGTDVTGAVFCTEGYGANTREVSYTIQ